MTGIFREVFNRLSDPAHLQGIPKFPQVRTVSFIRGYASA
jgi:hypothetical protein